MPLRRFGKYEVLARLATGGAANIFLARQPGAAGFHKLVCLKTLLPERAEDADFVAMFLDEARLAARLNHPNCVQIYDLGRVRGSYYISMEYIFGETLWNLLATVAKVRVPLPAAHVAAIVAAVCDGLHHAHELKDEHGRPYNLVHRDMSPQNVMITFEGQTKVVDFGIAKAETGRAPTSAGIVKGKFSYMSPEQITGGELDRRSDIYSLGIVLFECLASRRLYRGDSPEDIARLILEHRAPRLRDVLPDMPPALDQVCATALARHPSKRYQTALEMGDALRDYLDSVRYNHSAAALARLVEDRFKAQIPERRRAFEEALSGTFDEGALLKAFDAYPPRDIDLFPETPGPSEDFMEPSAAVEVASGVSFGSDSLDFAESTRDERPSLQGDVLDGDDETGDLPELLAMPVIGADASAEWRPELDPADLVPAPISLLQEPLRPERPRDAGDLTFDDVTRQGDESEQPTSFDPKDIVTRVDLDAAELEEVARTVEQALDGPTSIAPVGLGVAGLGVAGLGSVGLGSAIPHGSSSGRVPAHRTSLAAGGGRLALDRDPSNEDRTSLDAVASELAFVLGEPAAGGPAGGWSSASASLDEPLLREEGTRKQVPRGASGEGPSLPTQPTESVPRTLPHGGVPGAPARAASIVRSNFPRLPSGSRGSQDLIVIPAGRESLDAPVGAPGGLASALNRTAPGLDLTPLLHGPLHAPLHAPLPGPVTPQGSASTLGHTALAPTAPALTPAPTGARRFGWPVVAAALGVGLLLGLLGGLGVARAYYAPVSIPANVDGR